MRARVRGRCVFEASTDGEGWRGRRTIEESDVVAFGDSFAFGHGVNDRDFFADRMTRLKMKAVGADGEALRLYRNGQEVDAAPYRKLHRDPRIKALAIGTKLNLSGEEPDSLDFNMWDGRLDELAIFNHALSPEQIRELFKLGSVEKRRGT
jgi:hypothetical protein